MDALKAEGRNVVTTLTVGPCDPQPKQYSGSLMLQYGTGELPDVDWHPATLIPIYTSNGQQKITAKCEKHAYQDCELVVNGDTFPAVEVQDADLGIRVRAAAVNGHTVIAVVPVGDDVPGVTVAWPSDGN